ncbi:MAG: XRE family transcriptional regulator [Gallionella sp.]
MLTGFGSAGVLEVVENDAGGTYRAVCTVKFEESVFVLHCFEKRSKRGISTPKEDLDTVRSRLKVAETLAKELRNEKWLIDGIEVQRSSGSVYADLGLPDAEKLKIKTGLVAEIRKSMRRLGLTQQEAAKRMGISQPKVSDMMRGDFSNLSERELMDCLNRLGYDIEIKVKPATEPVGHLMPAIA